MSLVSFTNANGSDKSHMVKNFSKHVAHNLVAQQFDEFVCKPRGQIRRGGMANGKYSMNEPTSAIPNGTLCLSNTQIEKSFPILDFDIGMIVTIMPSHLTE